MTERNLLSLLTDKNEGLSQWFYSAILLEMLISVLASQRGTMSVLHDLWSLGHFLVSFRFLACTISFILSFSFILHLHLATGINKC